MLNPVTVTLLYGGVAALVVTLLGSTVSLLRLRSRTFVGTEVPTALVRPIRAHGNAAEWVPLGLILLGLLELSGVSSAALHVLGGTLVASRVIHAFGVLARNRASMLGATINYGLLATMAGWAIALHFAR